MQDLWAEGKWIDLWSLNHVFAGLLLLPALLWTGLTPIGALIVSFIIFFAWECIEWWFAVEQLTNQLMDMVTNYIGFSVAWYIYIVLGGGYGTRGFWLLAAGFVILEILGLRAFLKRESNYQ